MEIIAEFFSFLRHRKKYWLWPIFFLLIFFGALIALAHGSALAPFIYSLF
ncbi:DUF5989 family protein [Mucilaginibacter pedocola]|nr:DUF5989 family protein [Mucilaginibacter pedocola]